MSPQKPKDCARCFGLRHSFWGFQKMSPLKLRVVWYCVLNLNTLTALEKRIQQPSSCNFLASPLSPWTGISQCSEQALMNYTTDKNMNSPLRYRLQIRRPLKLSTVLYTHLKNLHIINRIKCTDKFILTVEVPETLKVFYLPRAVHILQGTSNSCSTTGNYKRSTKMLRRLSPIKLSKVTLTCSIHEQDDFFPPDLVVRRGADKSLAL
jgi:hypothetical protein